MRSHESGFTLPELIVVMILTALMSALLFDFALSYSRFGSTIQSNSVAFVERLNASDYFRNNLGLSSGLIEQTSIHDAHALVPDPVLGEHWQQLYAVGSTASLSEIDFGNSSSITPLFYFKKYTKTVDGDFAKNGVVFLEDEYVVYHDGPRQQIRVRTLPNDTITNNAARPTCAGAYVTASCPADKLIISDIDSVDMRYFSRSGAPVDFRSKDELDVVPCTNDVYPYTGCAGGVFSNVEVVEMTLNLSRRPDVATSNVTRSATVIRVALRNK